MKEKSTQGMSSCPGSNPGEPRPVRRQLEELQAIYSSAPVGLCTLDVGLRYLRINDHLAALNGAPAADHIGRTLRDMVPHIADQMEPVLRRIVATGEPVMDLAIAGKPAVQPGTTRRWTTNLLPVKDAKGRVIQLNAWLLEVTENRHVQQHLEKMNRELAQAHQWLNGIIDGTSDIIVALDMDCRVVAFNGAGAREFEKVFRLPLRPGDRLTDALAQYPKDQDTAVAMLKRALSGESFTVIQDFGGRVPRHNQYECTYSVLRDAEGAQIGVSLIARDTTQRIEEEERFRAAAECLSDVIFEWDLRDRITWFGDVDAIMGHTPGAFPRHASGWADLVHSQERAGVVSAIKRSLADSTPLAGTFRVRRKDGSYAVWSARGKIVRDPRGGAKKWIGAVTDITGRRRSEAIMAARLRLMTFSLTHSLAELLQATLDEAETLTESRIGFFHFMLPDQNALALQAWSSNTAKSMHAPEGAGRHCPVDQAGVWGDCARECRPVVHNNCASLPHRTGLPPGHAPVRRELAVPVMRGGLVTAVLGVGNKPVDYTEDDVTTVSALADFGWEIAENRRAAEALLESEKRYRELVDNTDTGLVTLDEAGIVLEANGPYVRMAGAQKREEVIGHSVLDWTAPDHRDINQAAVVRCARQDATKDFETVYLGNDRRRRHILINAVTRTTPQGRHIVAFCRDITERKLSELRLAELRTTLTARVRELEAATAHIRTLQGIIPICMHCHKIRDDQQSWQQLEQYFHENSDTLFSHSLCPECAKQHYSEYIVEDAAQAPETPGKG